MHVLYLKQTTVFAGAVQRVFEGVDGNALINVSRDNWNSAKVLIESGLSVNVNELESRWKATNFVFHGEASGRGLREPWFLDGE